MLLTWTKGGRVRLRLPALAAVGRPQPSTVVITIPNTQPASGNRAVAA